MMLTYIQNASGIIIERKVDEIVYLKTILSTDSTVVQRKTAYIIGNYLHSIWLFRSITIHGGPRHNCNGYALKKLILDNFNNTLTSVRSVSSISSTTL
ncbi:unnamed protein product, partial [Rotaria magnacalcarata]